MAVFLPKIKWLNHFIPKGNFVITMKLAFSILIGNWKTVEGLASNLETALHDASYSLHIYTFGPNGSKNIQVSCYFEEPNIVKSLSVFTCLSRCYWKNLACFFITYSGLCRRVIITRWLSFRVFFALSLNIIS